MADQPTLWFPGVLREVIAKTIEYTKTKKE